MRIIIGALTACVFVLAALPALAEDTTHLFREEVNWDTIVTTIKEQLVSEFGEEGIDVQVLEVQVQIPVWGSEPPVLSSGPEPRVPEPSSLASDLAHHHAMLSLAPPVLRLLSKKEVLQIIIPVALAEPVRWFWEWFRNSISSDDEGGATLPLWTPVEIITPDGSLTYDPQLSYLPYARAPE